MKYFKEIFIDEASTLQYHEDLNPRLWKNEKLIPRVRDKLRLFAETWRDYCHLTPGAVKDVIITGGNVNYNYTEKSDIDCHIVADFNLIPGDKKFKEEFLIDKKLLWTLTHNVTILGYPVEPYVQNKEQSYPKDQGVYSIRKDKWIQKPTNLHLNFNSDKELLKRVTEYKKMIDSMIRSHSSTEIIDQFRDKLRLMRQSSIQDRGEFSLENLVFKELRNDGYIEKLISYSRNSLDQRLSLY